MSGSYTRAQRLELERAVRERREPLCPVCGVRMNQQPVVPAANVPYVRHRVWLLCPQCRRGVSVDR
ncbi:MAG: hypothetical protein ACT443_13890 [Gemmatimonadota bacterium]